jgi:hypothetical protein
MLLNILSCGIFQFELHETDDSPVSVEDGGCSQFAVYGKIKTSQLYGYYGGKMTDLEKAAILTRVWELRDAGKEKEAHALQATIPLQPYLAKVAKKLHGADYLIEAGYNLSEAEAAFGSDWLTR